MPIDFCVTGNTTLTGWAEGRDLARAIWREAARRGGVAVGREWISHSIDLGDDWPTKAQAFNRKRWVNEFYNVDEQRKAAGEVIDVERANYPDRLLNGEFATNELRQWAQQGLELFPVQTLNVVSERSDFYEGWYGGYRLMPHMKEDWVRVWLHHHNASRMPNMVIAAHIAQQQDQTMRFRQLEPLRDAAIHPQWGGMKARQLIACVGGGLNGNGEPVEPDVFLSAVEKNKELGITTMMWLEGQAQKRAGLVRIGQKWGVA